MYRFIDSEKGKIEFKKKIAKMYCGLENPVVKNVFPMRTLEFPQEVLTRFIEKYFSSDSFKGCFDSLRLTGHDKC